MCTQEFLAEPLLEFLQRLAHQVFVPVRVHLRVVVGGFDPVDFGSAHPAGAFTVVHGDAL